MARRKRPEPLADLQVAIAALKGDQILAELAQQFDVHPNHHRLESRLLARAVAAFGETKRCGTGARSQNAARQDLAADAGERFFETSALAHAGLPSAKR